MLAAYYSCGCDSRELFAGWKIAQKESFQEHLNQYDVILLNIQHFLIGARKRSLIEYLEQEVIEELRKEYGTWIKNPDSGLADALKKFLPDQGKSLYS